MDSISFDKNYFSNKIDKKYRCCYFELIEKTILELNNFGKEGLTFEEYLTFIKPGKSEEQKSEHISVCYIINKNIVDRHRRCKLKEIPEVVESHYTTGNYAIFIKILCKNNDDLMHLLNQDIQNIKGIARTETFISLEQQIDRQIEI